MVKFLFGNKLMKTINSFLFCFILFSFYNLKSQAPVAIVTESFSASTPSVGSNAWTTDASSWSLNNNYASSRSGSYAAKIANGVYDKYFYIPVTFNQNHKYDVSFWVKNVIDIKMVYNETANLTTPLSVQTKTSVVSNTSWTQVTWTQYNHNAATTSGYIMVCLQNSTYGSSSAYIDDVTITETPPSCNYPATQASNITFSSTSYTSTNVSWTAGSGDNLLLVARTGTNTLTNPTDAMTYTANSVFGSGSQIGTGNYVVFNGSSSTTSVAVTGLSSNTTYSFTAYTYSSTGNCYLIPGTTNSVSTLDCIPSSQATFVAFSNVDTYSLSLNWTRGNGSNVLIVGKKSTSVTTNPTDGTTYTANSVFGSGSQIGTGNYVVYYGSGTSVNITGLIPQTTYSFYAYESNGNGLCYKTPAAITGTTSLRSSNYYVNGSYSATNDIYTTAAGTNTTNYGQDPNTPAATLAWLLNTSGYSFQSGDTIFVDAGTYSDANLSSPPNGVVIIGAGVSKTNFNNSGTNYFMRINDNNTVLSSMSLSNYNDNSTGTGQTLGVESNITGVKIINVLVYYETASNFASGYPIQVQSGASVNFSGGGAACTKGGGTSAGGGIGISSATVTIDNYLFYANEQAFQHGGSLNINGGDITIRNSGFKNNVLGDYRGAAMYVQAGNVNVYDSEISDNHTQLTADVAGGSIWIIGGTFRMTRSKIMNHTQDGASYSLGAGVAVTGGTVTIDSCYFSGNQGKTSVATDMYVGGGVALARYNTFASASTQIGRGAGTFTIANSGNPSSNGTITKTNTITTTYTPSPVVPAYTGTCSSSISTFTLLPIELTQFNGDCSDNHVLITWQTATEKNNKVFYIERSVNGVDFYIIGSVAGAGNSLQLRNYKFADSDDIKGIMYYRLSQEDYDGKRSQSNIISVDKSCKVTAEPEIILYPNPSEQNLTIDVKLLRSSQIGIEVVDAIGRTVKIINVKRYDDGIQSIEINLNDLSKGIYFFNISVNEQQFSRKMIKL